MKSIYLLNLLLGAICLFSIGMLGKTVVEDFANYEASSACIAELISIGVERSDITATNGTCARKSKQ